MCSLLYLSGEFGFESIWFYSWFISARLVGKFLKNFIDTCIFLISAHLHPRVNDDYTDFRVFFYAELHQTTVPLGCTTIVLMYGERDILWLLHEWRRKGYGYPSWKWILWTGCCEGTGSVVKSWDYTGTAYWFPPLSQRRECEARGHGRGTERIKQAMGLLCPSSLSVQPSLHLMYFLLNFIFGNHQNTIEIFQLTLFCFEKLESYKIIWFYILI